MLNFERHGLSALFLDMSVDEFNALKSDIEKNGFTDPVIVVHEDKILDGWHRYQIATELDILQQLDFTKLEGTDPVAFVVSKNLHRRHLTPSQRAQIVVEANTWATGKDNQHTVQKVNSPNGPIKSEPQMAKDANVGKSTIKRAKAVSRAGRSQEVISGEKSASAVIQEEREKQPEPPEMQEQLPVEDSEQGYDNIKVGELREERGKDLAARTREHNRQADIRQRVYLLTVNVDIGARFETVPNEVFDELYQQLCDEECGLYTDDDFPDVSESDEVQEYKNARRYVRQGLQLAITSLAEQLRDKCWVEQESDE